MPLRSRLILSIGMVLLVCLAGGSLLVGWRAASSVRTELRAALDVGAQTIRNGIDDLARADDRATASRHLVATFNGNRHVRAMLVNGLEHSPVHSALFVSAHPAPAWFRHLIGDERMEVRIPVLPPGDGEDVIVLRADPINEIGEVWADSRDAIMVLTIFAAMSALSIFVVVGRALRPLENLSAAFHHVGEGQYHGTVREHGSQEFVRLARAFNLMTRQLAVAAAQNRRLNERLLTLQVEERADLARDLHDEIGPLLFAVDMTAATIGQLSGDQRDTGIPLHVRSIHDAIGRMQRHVRMLLGRLRPIQAIGLETAIKRLAEFWYVRQPSTVFTISVSVPEDQIQDDLREAIYRVVQEGVSNAIRHGEPARVEITVMEDGAGGIHVEVTDDGKGMMVDGLVGRDPQQLGLIGMRERVTALAGSLSVQPGLDGKGFKLVASLPCDDLALHHNVDETE